MRYLLFLLLTTSLSAQNAPSGYQQQFTFAVDDVLANRNQPYTVDCEKALYDAFVVPNDPDVITPKGRYLEAYTRDREPLSPAHTNGFFETIHYAYAQHKSLVINPDMIWLTIAQGLAHHIRENSDSLRHKLVSHEGKKTLFVDVTGKIQIGNENSDWAFAFEQLRLQVANASSPALADLVAGRFSGTSPDAAIAFDITMLDAMSPYFDYWVGIICGIPSITIEGTPDDWRQIEARAAKLPEYGLDWWYQDLKPILAEFTLAAEQNPNRQFWQSIVKDFEEPICGGDTYLSGWITRLYPYLKKQDKWQRNPIIGLKTTDLFRFVDKKPIESASGSNSSYYGLCMGKTYKTIEYFGPKVTTKDIPSGISMTDLNVDNMGQLIKMELKAGFIGHRLEKDNTLRPVIGWAVVNTSEKPDADVLQRYEQFKQHRH
jgi:hypothetical protein